LEPNYIAGTPYVGMDVVMKAGPGGNRGVFDAWDVANARKVWSIPEDLPVWSGALVTAGDVAFYGTMDGWFKAVDARNGKLLWQFKTGSGIIGQRMELIGDGLVTDTQVVKMLVLLTKLMQGLISQGRSHWPEDLPIASQQDCILAIGLTNRLEGGGKAFTLARGQDTKRPLA
jgi:glucose dehydrogenase